ncbi:MAG TPA: 2-dehydropantoate 2-reductase [Alphaproteobacteria bacterium]|nr:2-dehydropantoate 2-reductase [Alphaproteobacteria bacterium]
MRILVLGAGALGGYFGGRLLEAGADVSFLVRPRRARELAEHGLVVRSPFGDIQRPVPILKSGEAEGAFDLALLTCKAYDLDDAMAAIAPLLAADGAVLPLLNGLAHLDRLDAAFGAGRVLGGTAHISATLGERGAILHLNDLHRITFGERDGAVSARCEALAAAFARSKVESRFSNHIMQEMWEKMAFLASLAALTCLMRASVGDIAATAEGRAVAEELYAEIQAVAAAWGHPPRPPAVKQALTLMTQPGSSFVASMLRDIERGGPTEGDHIVGDLLRRARAKDLPTPLLRLANCHLQAYEQRRAHGG